MKKKTKKTGGVQFESFPAPLDQVTAYTQKQAQSGEIKGHYLTRLLIRLVLKFAQSLTWKTAYRVGTGIGTLLYRLKIRRDVAMVNMNIVYGQTKSAIEKNRIYRASMINLGRVVINYMRLPYMGPEFWEKNCDWKNEAILKDVMNRKKGVILLAGHIGMMDLPGGKFGMGGYPIGVVGKKIANPALNKLVLDTRKAMNLGTINYKNSMVRILRGLKRGEAIAMALDQNMKLRYGIFIDWMGRPASSVSAPAYVMRETGAAAIAGYCYQKDIDRFEVVVTEEVSWEPFPGDPEKEIVINTQKQSDAVQRIIFNHPELWFWIHRRWKTQPHGTPNPYR